MSKTKRFVVGVVVLLVVGTVAMKWRGDTVNTRVMNEIRSEPFGERARKTMIVTLEDGRVYPVNYLREDGRVYMGIDGLWWRVFQGAGSRVQMEINDQIVTGTGVALGGDGMGDGPASFGCTSTGGYTLNTVRINPKPSPNQVIPAAIANIRRLVMPEL